MVAAGVVRDTILASWTRSREWDIHVDNVELPRRLRPRARLPADPCGHEPVLADVADQLATEPVSVILTDADGVVLDRRTGDSALRQHLDRVWLAPGFSYAEKFVGTNGIGTALEGRGPGRGVRPRALRGAAGRPSPAPARPIWHPVSGKLLGVIDLTCWRPDAGRFMSTAVARIARQIEARAAGPVRPARARAAARLPDRLPAQPAAP